MEESRLYKQQRRVSAEEAILEPGAHCRVRSEVSLGVI